MEKKGNIDNYIHTTLGLSCEIRDGVDLSLPLYLKGRFDIRMIIIEGSEFLLLFPQKKLQMTASVVCSSAESLRKTTAQKTIIVLNEITADARRILISKKENFVVPDKQLYVPQLGLLLQERGMQHGKDKESELLSPAAQRMVLYHLQAESLNGRPLNCISELLGYPPKTITQIVKELKDKELCFLTGNDSRSKFLQFTDEGKALWDRSLPFLQTPIKAVRYVDDLNSVSGIETSFTGDKALSHYTFIADNGEKSICVYWRSEEIKGIEMREHEGEVRVELWKYPPIIINESDFVDPLSLSLCFKDDNDERVNAEVQKLIEKTLGK